jgi:hypothetical protein
MRLEGALDLLAGRVGVDTEPVADTDALDHEHAVVEFDLADRLAGQPFLARVDVACFQRASEGAGQSAAGGGDDVVEGGRVLGLAAARDAVVVCDLGVDAEEDRICLGRQLGASKRAAESRDSDARGVDDVRHGASLRLAASVPVGLEPALEAANLELKLVRKPSQQLGEVDVVFEPCAGASTAARAPVSPGEVWKILATDPRDPCGDPCGRRFE